MRGHRLNIFSNRFKYVGLAVGPHKLFKYCCVVNFAVEYEEKDEEEVVFYDKLPDLAPVSSTDDDYDQEELDEMAEWKGPGGFPYGRPPLNNANKKMRKKSASSKNSKDSPKNGNFKMNFQKKRADVKVNTKMSSNGGRKGDYRNKTSKSPRNQPPKFINPKINTKIDQHKGHNHKKEAKCKVMSVPMGKHHSSDEEVFEEVIHLKRKQTMESYNSEKEMVTVGNLPPPRSHSSEEEEVETFKGGGFNFQKKKTEHNNMYMKEGVNKDKYIKNANMKRNKTISKDKAKPVKRVINKKSNTGPLQTPQSLKGKPYTITRTGQSMKTGKSPRRNNQYVKYSAPNQLQNVSVKSTPIQNMNQNIGYKMNQKKKQQTTANRMPKMLKQKAKAQDLNKLRSKQLLDMDDFNMPFDALNCLTKRITKIQGNQRIRTVQKIFTMKDGTQEVHENVFVERIDGN